MVKGYTILESFGNNLCYFVSPMCFDALEQSELVSHVSLQNHCKFVLSTFKVKRGFWLRMHATFRNPTIKTGSEIEDQRLRDTGIDSYLCRKILLMHHLVVDGGMLFISQPPMPLDVRIGLLLAFCDMDQQKSHSLWLSAVGRRSLLSEQVLVLKLVTKSLSTRKTNRLASLPSSLNSKHLHCTSVRAHIVSCSILTP